MGSKLLGSYVGQGWQVGSLCELRSGENRWGAGAQPLRWVSVFLSDECLPVFLFPDALLLYFCRDVVFLLDKPEPKDVGVSTHPFAFSNCRPSSWKKLVATYFEAGPSHKTACILLWKQRTTENSWFFTVWCAVSTSTTWTQNAFTSTISSNNELDFTRVLRDNQIYFKHPRCFLKGWMLACAEQQDGLVGVAVFFPPCCQRSFVYSQMATFRSSPWTSAFKVLATFFVFVWCRCSLVSF